MYYGRQRRWSILCSSLTRHAGCANASISKATQGRHTHSSVLRVF